jgi:beta-mannanase
LYELSERSDSESRPYYPGDDMVDWNGISLYYKGPDFQNINQAQPAGFVAETLAGYDPYNVRGSTAPARKDSS